MLGFVEIANSVVLELPTAIVTFGQPSGILYSRNFQDLVYEVKYE